METTPPALFVFVHGFRDRPEAWGPVVAAMGLPDDRVLAVALTPASGERSVANTLDAYANQVIAAIAKHQMDRPIAPIILVGHSMGAQIAELAAERVGVAGLVLATPAHLQGHKLNDQVRARFQASCAERRAEPIAHARRAFSVNLTEEALAIMVRGAQATPEAFALEQLAAWTGGHPAGERASVITAAVLVLTASDDPFFTKASVDATVVPRFSDVASHTIEAAGHWPQLEKPEEFAAQLLAFEARL